MTFRITAAGTLLSIAFSVLGSLTADSNTDWHLWMLGVQMQGITGCMLILAWWSVQCKGAELIAAMEATLALEASGLRAAGRSSSASAGVVSGVATASNHDGDLPRHAGGYSARHGCRCCVPGAGGAARRGGVATAPLPDAVGGMVMDDGGSALAGGRTGPGPPDAAQTAPAAAAAGRGNAGTAVSRPVVVVVGSRRVAVGSAPERATLPAGRGRSHAAETDDSRAPDRVWEAALRTAEAAVLVVGCEPAHDTPGAVRRLERWERERLRLGLTAVGGAAAEAAAWRGGVLSRVGLAAASAGRGPVRWALLGRSDRASSESVVGELRRAGRRARGVGRGARWSCPARGLGDSAAVLDGTGAAAPALPGSAAAGPPPSLAAGGTTPLPWAAPPGRAGSPAALVPVVAATGAGEALGAAPSRSRDDGGGDMERGGSAAGRRGSPSRRRSMSADAGAARAAGRGARYAMKRGLEGAPTPAGALSRSGAAALDVTGVGGASGDGGAGSDEDAGGTMLVSGLVGAGGERAEVMLTGVLRSRAHHRRLRAGLDQFRRIRMVLVVSLWLEALSMMAFSCWDFLRSKIDYQLLLSWASGKAMAVVFVSTVRIPVPVRGEALEGTCRSEASRGRCRTQAKATGLLWSRCFRRRPMLAAAMQMPATDLGARGQGATRPGE